MLTARSPADWQRAASSSFLPLECRTFTHEFNGTIERYGLSREVMVAAVQSDATVVTRTQNLARQSENDDLHVSLQLSSTGAIHQQDRCVRVAPGSLTVYETHVPYMLDYSQPHQQQLVFRVPRTLLTLPHGALGQLVMQPLERSAQARVFSAFAAALRTEATSLQQPGPLGLLAIEMLTTTLASIAAEAHVLPASDAARLQLILADLREHLHEPWLTPEELARRHHMSRRALYSLFSSADRTPAETIRAERLALAQRLLRSHPQFTLDAVAARSGFTDGKALGRAFRAGMGVTVTEWLERL
ncbi:helix-turn-helix domain-containing protein [Leucobacter sp. HY1910]